LNSVSSNRQRARDIAETSGAADPETLAAIDEIHARQAQKLEAEAKAEGVQQVQQIKATAQQLNYHNQRIEEIRRAATEGEIPEEPPMLETAPAEDIQLRDIRDREASQRAMEIQLMDIERDSNLSEMERKFLREPLIKERTKAEMELLKLRQKLPELHTAMEAGPVPGAAPEEVTVREADPTPIGEIIPTQPTSDNPSTTQPQAQPAPAQTLPPEPVAASDQSQPTPTLTETSSSTTPNIREPWVNNALALGRQGKDQRGPLANALKVLTPAERAAAASRAGVTNPTLDDHILLAREISDAAGRPPPADPGQPQVAESPWRPGETTGVKNEVIDNERQAMGLPPMVKEAAREWGGLWDSASSTLKSNPQAGYERVATLREGGLHNDADAALLLRHKIELEHAAQLAAREINSPNTTDEARVLAVERRSAALRALTDVHEVLRKTGSEVGRSLNARKMLMDRNEVPTAAEMEADRRVAKGRDLTPDERDEVMQVHTELTDARAEVDAAEEAQSRAEAVTEMQAVADDLASRVEPAQETPKASQKVKDAAVRREQRKKAGEEALKRIREKLGMRVNVGLDPTVLADMAIYGHYIIGEGITKLSEFTAHMVEQFGEVVRKELPAIFKSANAMSLDADAALTKASKKAQRLAGQSAVAIVEAQAKEVKPGAPVDPKIARELLEAHIREGVSGADDLTNRLRESLSDVYQREVSDRDVWDAITGYGKISKPSSDAIKKLAGAYRTEALLRRKLSAAQAKEAILKTGPQRERATEEVRRLQRELNEEMRKNGYNATAEGQVRGRLDAIKQGLKNQIQDLESVIAGRQKLRAKGMPVELDAESRDLQDRLKALREHLQTLPEFRAQLDAAENTRAIAAAKASRDEYTRRIAEKEFESAGQKDKVVSAELRRMRAERDLAAKNYRDAKAASDVGKSADLQRKIQAAVKAVEAKEQALIDEKWTTKNPGRKLSDNPELRALQERSIELTKELRTQKHGDGMLALQEWYDKRKATLLDALAGKEAQKRPGRITPDTPEAKAMRDEIKDLERSVREKRAPEAALKSIKERIKRLQKRIDDADFSRAATKERPDSPEIRDAQRALDDLQEIYDQMNEADGTRANETYRKRLELQQARMDETIAKGFPKAAPRKELKLDAKSLEAKIKFDKAKERYEKLKFLDEQAKQTRMQRFWRGIRTTRDAFTNITSSYDFSAPRQASKALYANLTRLITQPTTGARMIGGAFKSMFKSWATDTGAREVEIARQNRPNALSGVDKASGVEFSSLETNEFTKFEENAHSIIDTWAAEPIRTGNALKTAAGLPLKLASRGVRMSNRAFVGFLNATRASLLDELLRANFQDRPPTDIELKAVGNLVNIATGRGKLNPKVAQVASNVLWAPKLLASQFQFLGGQPFYDGTARTRLIAAKEYVRIIGGMATIAAISRLFDDKKENDPRSTDFGKIVRGDSHIDLWGGLQQVVTLLARLGTRSTKNSKGVVKSTGPDRKFSDPSSINIATNFMRSKLRPDLGTLVDIAAGENFIGERTTPTSVAQSLLVPLPMRDIREQFQKQGWPEFLIEQILGQFGAGVSHYDPTAKREKEKQK